MTLWTTIEVLCRLIFEDLRREKSTPLAEIRSGEISFDATLFESYDIVHCAIFTVTDTNLGVQPPVETNPAHQIQHRQTIHNRRRGNQGSQDDARFAPIDHIVGVIAQLCLIAGKAAHRAGIRISRTDLTIGDALIRRRPSTGEPCAIVLLD